MGMMYPAGGGFSAAPYGVAYMPGGNFSSYATPPYIPGMPGGGMPYPGGYPMPFPGGSPYGFPGPGNTYQNPFYGMNPNGMGGMNSYNPWFSGVNNQVNAGGLSNFYAYQQQQLQSQIRQLQSQVQLQQDAQTAAQALSEAQSRYNSILGQMSGSYYGSGGYYGVGGGYNVGGYIGLGGAGVIGPSIANPNGTAPGRTPTRY
jgi:hypothetical protein